MFDTDYLTQDEIRGFYLQPLKRFEGVRLEEHINRLISDTGVLSEEQEARYASARACFDLILNDMEETLSASGEEAGDAHL